jgi:phosphoribosyl 1,2-cyclic phosphodiesterase
MRVIVLGSGSSGNATLVEAGTDRVLVDAGFSGRDIAARMGEFGVEPESLQAVVITHDHGDHTRGMGVLARRYGIPLLMTVRTAAACARLLDGSESVRHYQAERVFRIGRLEIRPFLTVHDAVDPVAVTLRDRETGCRLGIATDLGRPTSAVRAALAGCHLLVLEANHDDAMLWRGPYPWSVKQRIASSHGHLSNRASAELMTELFHPGLGGVVLAHLSEHCNEPVLAREVIGEALERLGYPGVLTVAGPARPLAPLEVMELRRRIGATAEQLELL